MNENKRVQTELWVTGSDGVFFFVCFFYVLGHTLQNLAGCSVTQQPEKRDPRPSIVGNFICEDSTFTAAPRCVLLLYISVGVCVRATIMARVRRSRELNCPFLRAWL